MAESFQKLSRFLELLLKPAFQPILTGPLLYILLKGPDSVRDPVIRAIQALPGSFTVENAVTVLKWLFGISACSKINSWLNNRALNQWRVSSSKKDWNWKQEVAVVTGGSSGIGAVIVRSLMREGVKVAVVDIQPLPPSMQGYANIAFFQCDITEAEQVHSTGGAIRKKFGSPSILVNNAGIGNARSIIEHDDAFLHKIFGVNLLSHFTTVKEFMPEMLKRNKGHIVTIASMASFVGVPGIADYAATKAGALAFHEVLNQELKHHHKKTGILTTSVHPNWVSTPLVHSFEKQIEKFNGPLLSAEAVGVAIADQILSCKSGQLIFPKAMSRVTGIRGWPNWMQEGLRDIIGKPSVKTLGRRT